MRKNNDLVSGKPSNREGLWAMTNKQASGRCSENRVKLPEMRRNLQEFIEDVSTGMIGRLSIRWSDSHLLSIRGWALLKCIRLSTHYRFIKFVPDIVACIAATARVELDCCSTAILDVWPIIEVML
jgi:hypothetical protein